MLQQLLYIQYMVIRLKLSASRFFFPRGHAGASNILFAKCQVEERTLQRKHATLSVGKKCMNQV